MMTHGGDIYTNSGIQYDFSVSLNPLGPPEGAVSAVRESAARIQCYPDPKCRALYEALSGSLGVPRGNILVGNGASALLRAAAQAVRPAHVYLPAPTYGGYETALRQTDAQIHRLCLREEDEFALTDAFVREFEGAAAQASQRNSDRILFLCNPNNPVGSCIDEGLLLRILGICEERGIYCILDECYMELTQDGAQRSMTGRLREYPHLLVLRAFTKTYAMPGVRLGYMLGADKSLLERIALQLEEWSVSLPSQEAGLAALGDAQYLPRARKACAAERAFLAEGLAGRGMKVYDGTANFILFASGEPLFEKLRARGILIRDCAGIPGLTPVKGSKYYYRVGVRGRSENEALLEALEEVLLSAE